ncbi:MAG: ubiquinol-cytochrome C chaperone family protein [Sphingomonas sp.]
MGLFDRFLRPRHGIDASPLYTAVVAAGRAPHWYVAGGVPDTQDGRFDMIATVLALVLIRLDGEAAGAPLGVALTDLFIADMDAQLRELGIGDVGLGKQVGQMVGLLGGRMGAYRDALAGGDLGEALIRNLYRGVAPGAAALAHVEAALRALAAGLAGQSLADLQAGRLP